MVFLLPRAFAANIITVVYCQCKPNHSNFCRFQRYWIVLTICLFFTLFPCYRALYGMKGYRSILKTGPSKNAVKNMLLKQHFSHLNAHHHQRIRYPSHLLHRALFSTKNNLPPIAWPVDRVRSQFVDYFVDKHQHVNYKSSPCVPYNDPTLLFTNAGMNQFKPIFIGTVEPTSPLASLKRAVNSQKCIRAGGKHNDLDDVGKDTYHHTFFEMLGTWSFGDYFKKEAIEWAFDILVNVYKLDPNRLYASYFAGDPALGLPADEEARQIWSQFLPEDRILPFDKKANFWEMGDSGPCGPCTEIHYDRIGGRNAAALVNADDPDVIEIWNLVFIQFNRELDGSLRPLPNKHIDTGMGLERLTSILQNVRSNYDTDVFMPLFQAIEKEIGTCPPYQGKVGAEDAQQNFRDTAYRVIADHLRTLTFAITDGAVPSNEGRGYVLRRILRRAVRYGIQTLGAKPGFFSALIPQVASNFGGAFPELIEANQTVVDLVRDEEIAFASLLDRGVKYFNEMLVEMKKENINTIDGDKAFYLYDTLGFPIDLTQIMAAEQGLTVDLEGFHHAMNEQKERSRIAAKAKRLAGRVASALGAEQVAFLQQHGVKPTNDSFKYKWNQTLDTKLEAIFTKQGFVQELHLGSSAEQETIGVILRDTTFYAESGGQVSDVGKLTISTGNTNVSLDVLDAQLFGGYVLHTCVPSEISTIEESLAIQPAMSVNVEVDYNRRRRVAPNHTMTHVLNCALRKSIGGNIDQKGSLVSEDKLRFDFNLNRGLSTEELENIENIVNGVINNNLTVSSEVLPLQQASKISGLRAVFGEVYPDPVRVLSIGPSIKDLNQNPTNEQWMDFSVEFCGGTHISQTKDAEAFAILEETAVAKGIRRISAVTGSDALQTIARSQAFKTEVAAIENEVANVANLNLDQLSVLDKRVVDLRNKISTSSITQSTQTRSRQLLDKLQKQIYSQKTYLITQQTNQAIASVVQDVADLVKTGRKTAVINFAGIGSDGKAIKRAMDEIKKAAPNLSFLGMSEDDDKKLTIFAHVTEEAQKLGMNANEWITAAMKTTSGRGGGKAGSAQGSIANITSDIVHLVNKQSAQFVQDRGWFSSS